VESHHNVAKVHYKTTSRHTSSLHTAPFLPTSPQAGIKVYHDVHTPELAQKAADAGVDGLNLLNSSMGGKRCA
jgi:NAD(P)H-dependent flavin oxidoreductase YrpB (nitropropane dioxygenase family)